MNIQRDTEYRFGELVQSPEYSNEQGVVVTIKSLATGQTMKVYLDEPTQDVQGGGTINFTSYTGHFDEEEFMVTPSDGFEITGLPLMYPYWSGKGGKNVVIDVENYSIISRDNNMTDPINLLSSPIRIALTDSQDQSEIVNENVVLYEFSRPGSTSGEPIVVPVNPGGEIEEH